MFNVQQILFPKVAPVYGVMWKNTVERGRPQMTIRRKRSACWIPKPTNTHSDCYTYCFSTVSMVARTHLNVMLYAHCLSCYAHLWWCKVWATLGFGMINILWSLFKFFYIWAVYSECQQTSYKCSRENQEKVCFTEARPLFCGVRLWWRYVCQKYDCKCMRNL